MREFFLAQLDYIFFMYGLAFILVFFVCLSLQKQFKTRIPWDYFGLFGLLHGTNEWLDMLALSLCDPPLFKWIRLVIMAASFVCLLEFGRILCERFKYVRIGRWIYIPLFLIAFLGVSAGESGMNATIRYTLGFVGAWWAALALWRLSKESKDGSWTMALAAVAVAVYAVAAGFFVPKVAWLFAARINQDSFLRLAGFPIQLLRGFAACVIVLAIWRYHEDLSEQKADSRMTHSGEEPAAGMILGLILILVGGWLWANWEGQNEGAKQRARLLNISQQVVATLDPEMVKGLVGSAADAKSPAYQTLKARLQHLHNAVTSVRFIYIMRKVEGRIIFLADSESAGSKDESPPGQVYEEASPKIFDVFASGKGAVDNPTADRWGTWISAYEPLNDGRTGELIAVLGVDQSARDFNFAVAFARLKRIVFTGLICLLALFVFVYWKKIAAAFEQNKEGKGMDLVLRWGIAAIVMLFGTTLTIFLFLELRHNALDSFRTTFIQRAINRAQNISQELERQLDRLDGLRRFLDVQESVQRDEFSQYAAPILKGVPVQALEWVPRVAFGDRIFYESSAKQDGLGGFGIYEKDTRGKKIRALAREEYYPVYYLEPLEGNEMALGFDLASDPVRCAAMEKSRDSGQPVATPPLVLVQRGQKKTGILVFMPVYVKDLPKRTIEQRRKSLKGFVLAVYDADEFLKGVYSRTPPEGLSCLIEDLAAPPESRVLYRHAIRDGTVNWGRPLLKYEMSLPMPDRQWRVTIVPGSAFIKRNLSAAYWWILFIGLFLTAWVAAFLNFLATARYRAELLVELRTRELNKEKESLAKSEERFRQLAEGTGEFIWEVDRDGLYTYASPMVEKMYGYKPEEIVGKKYFYDFFPPEEKEKMVQGIFAGFKKKEVFRDFLNPIIHRNGQTVLLTSNAMPMVDGSGNLLGYRGIDRDITAAKIAEEALRRREAYLTSILDNFPYLVWLKDVHGKYLSVNSIFAKACGRDIHEIVGKGDEGLWPPELVEKYRADDRQVMQNQSKAVFEEPIVENGVAGYFETYKSPIFDNEGLVIGTVGFAQDITERKKAEAALRESEERYKKITSSITDYIYTVHVADGKPVSTTYGPGCLPVTGYSSEDFLSRSSLWIEIVVPEDRPIVERQIGDIFSGTKIDPIEHRICHKNGQIRWVSNTIVPQYDNTGKLVGYDGLIADISERKKAEEVLKQAKETAEKALAMKDEFTSTVSHELRTPLAAIKSSVDILDMGAPGNLNDEQRVFIKRVKSNIDRLARLINEILDLSKLESGKRRLNLVPLFPEVFVREIVELQSTVVKNKGLKIGMDLETNLPVFWADKDLLTQVLNNLINNALKFTKEGKIAISVSCPDRKMMQFCVRDTGIGIKQEDQVRLFQKFQQVGAVSQQIGGTGLGLAICREIVTRHGGRIWVESEFAKGSAFYFTIPEKKRKRILIVRDDQAAKDNMEGVLSQSDQYEIEQAPDGFMTGQTSAEFAPPDLVILDLELPQMNGLKVCSAIKGDSKTVDTKIIVLSDLLTEEQEKRVWEAGADDLLKKPIHPEEMILKIERLI